MKIYPLTFVLALFISSTALSQNALDENGNRTGKWKGSYPDNTIRYEANFKDGKPVGIMKRYNQEGILVVTMNFYDGTDRCHTKMLSETGETQAEGVYDKKLKDSIWTYFGSEGAVRMQESYNMGKQEGNSIGFYPSGNISQKLHYKDGLKHGSWIQFFENGDTMMTANYEMGVLNGSYLTYYPEGILQSSGEFVNDVKNGDWKYYTEEGEEKSTLNYNMGELLNPEVMEDSYEKFIKLIEDNLGNVPDPADGNI